MIEWVLVVTLLMPLPGIPDVWVSPPLSTEAECLEQAESWPRWRTVHDRHGFLTSLQEAKCQQRADYEWSLKRGDGDGVWECPNGTCD